MLRLLLISLAVLALAACGARDPGPTQTAPAALENNATAAALPQATLPAPAATALAPEATATTPATAVPAASATAEPQPTAAPGLTAASGDPLLRTYRSLVAIQVNTALVAETVAQVQAGRIDQDEMQVAALALGALTQAVDEGLPGLTPPPELDAQWQAAVAHHAAVKALGARWLLGQVEVAEVSAALAPIQADLERLVSEADAVVAAQYGVSAAELTEHRVRLVQAVGGVFE
jgi:hypothetical protein